MIPQTFEQWANCIVNDCKIKLSQEFAQQRLAVYENEQSKENQNFITLYGYQHLVNVVLWLKQISNSFKQQII